MFLFILQAFGINMNSRKTLFEVSSQAFWDQMEFPEDASTRCCFTLHVLFSLFHFACIYRNQLPLRLDVVEYEQLDFPRAASQHKI